ncbi:tetratricopeptide repeat protein [Amycolatopsis sp. NPDC051371]|uniref:tetratricopeptide repeat protein n=1 Tax=Amycolatopsis sp. NPDC051371 TaxID=3155800 RepID=UPI0034325F79
MDDTQGRTPPVQIPAPVEGFVSREAVLDLLDRTWRRRVDRPPIVVLSGIGGVGKTTVAVRWLSDRRDRFPGGLLYARLSEPGGDPVPISEILFGFLVAIGVPADTIPPQSGQRSAVFRAAVEGRFVGILLDDAVSAGQVRALLPATASAMVVVTSRRQLGGLAMDGAELLDLAPLTPDASRRLLGEAAGPERVAAEPDAAGTIVEICGGLPLALGIIGARLRARPLRSLAREASAYARHLGAGSAAPDDVREVQAVFDTSYAALPDGAARVYRACGLHPGPDVSLDALADVLGEPSAHVEDAVDTLVSANLLADAANDRVAQHDLLRRDARLRAERELESADQAAVVRGFTRWYLARAQAADDLIHPQRPRLGVTPPGRHRKAFPDRAAAVAWWRRDLRSIHAVVTEADRRHWDEELWQFCEASWGFFLHHRDYEPWVAMHTAGVAAAQRCGVPLVEARLRSQLGFAYAKLRRFDEAVTQNSIALRLGEQQAHGPTRATALSQLGRAARGQGDFFAALGYYRRAAQLQEDLGIPRGVALCRRRCGEVLAKLGHDEEAITELTAAAKAMAELGDPIQHVRAATAAARLRSRQGRHDEARLVLVDALRVVRDLDSPYYTAEVLAVLGQVELEAGHGDDGRRHRAEARELYARLGDPRDGEIAEPAAAPDDPGAAAGKRDDRGPGSGS